MDVFPPTLNPGSNSPNSSELFLGSSGGLQTTGVWVLFHWSLGLKQPLPRSVFLLVPALNAVTGQTTPPSFQELAGGQLQTPTQRTSPSPALSQAAPSDSACTAHSAGGSWAWVALTARRLSLDSSPSSACASPHFREGKTERTSPCRSGASRFRGGSEPRSPARANSLAPGSRPEKRSADGHRALLRSPRLALDPATRKPGPVRLSPRSLQPPGTSHRSHALWTTSGKGQTLSGT